MATLQQDVSQSLAAIPGAIVLAILALALGLVEVDKVVDLEGSFVFSGDQPAARTVLSVIATSLITVAGLTFSITMVVLQLAAGQFSPRILRTFFADRITQVTIGAFVGIFVYSLVVLRAVGSFDQDGFVPRLSVTVGTVLAIGAVILLIGFLHHVSRLIQVSHVAARIADLTLDRVAACHPRQVGEGSPDEDPSRLRGAWLAAGTPELVHPARPGFVRSVDADRIRAVLEAAGAGRAAVLVRPGDFVGPQDAVVEVWPAEAGRRCGGQVRDAIGIGDERDLDQDVGFGLRQLTDIGLKALSPAVNDPATAVTCVGYLRALLVALASREGSPAVRHAGDVTLLIPARSFSEHLELLDHLGMAAGSDPWVSGEIVRAVAAVARRAAEAGSPDRAAEARALGLRIAGFAQEHAPTAAHGDELRRLGDEVRSAGR